MKLSLWAAAASSAAFVTSGSVEAVLPLSRWPLVMAHDAATTYLPDGSLVYAWVKTQSSGGFGKLAACGALALAVRSLLVPQKDPSGSKLIMAHGVVPVIVELREAVDDAAAWWAAGDRSQPVLLYLNHFGGLSPYSSADARDASLALLSNRSDVRILRGTEVDTVDVPSLLRQGQGLLVVLEEDVIENWDSQVVCFSPKPRFRCIGARSPTRTRLRPAARLPGRRDASAARAGQAHDDPGSLADIGHVGHHGPAVAELDPRHARQVGPQQLGAQSGAQRVVDSGARGGLRPTRPSRRSRRCSMPRAPRK
jgi:hypothetical protein